LYSGLAYETNARLWSVCSLLMNSIFEHCEFFRKFYVSKIISDELFVFRKRNIATVVAFHIYES